MLTFPINPLDRAMDWDLLHRSVVSIFDSYHAPEQDVLIEVIQNSVDAIEERAIEASKNKEKFVPEIRIRIDTAKNALEIHDNGVGVPESILQQLGSPHNTSKKSGRRRGHKGVGLTYVAWSTEKFRFATRHANSKQPYAGLLAGASDWVQDGGGPCPVIREDSAYAKELIPGPSGASFFFQFPPAARVLSTFRRLTAGGQEVFLRTKTAIGNVDLPHVDEKDVDDWISRARVSVVVDNGLPQELLGLNGVPRCLQRALLRRQHDPATLRQGRWS
ncbi:MAG: ATP-binding protein [bacterium]